MLANLQMLGGQLADQANLSTLFNVSWAMLAGIIVGSMPGRITASIKGRDGSSQAASLHNSKTSRRVAKTSSGGTKPRKNR